MIYRILLDPQGGDGSGTPAPAPADPSEGFKALLAKHNNDALRVAESLHDENYKLRQKNAALRSSVPDEGSVVLKGDDAKDWTKYRDLGKPSEVKASLDSGRVATEERDRFARGEVYRKVADAAGYKPSVFVQMAERDGLAVELVEGKKDGKAVTTAVVKGEGDSTTPLEEYVDRNWSDFKPALVGGAGPEKKATSTTPPRRPFGMPASPSDDPDESARRALQSTGIYRSGL